MTTVLRTSLSFVVTVALALTTGLALSGPAAAQPPVPKISADFNANVDYGPDTGRDLVVWRGTTGNSVGDELLINENVLDEARFTYVFQDGSISRGQSFDYAVEACEFEKAACQAAVATDARVMANRLRAAAATETSQCSSPTRQLLFDVQMPQRATIIRASGQATLLFSASLGAGVIGGLDPKTAATAAIVTAAGVFFAGVLGEIQTTADQRGIRAESLVATGAAIRAVGDRIIRELDENGLAGPAVCAAIERALAAETPVAAGRIEADIAARDEL